MAFYQLEHLTQLLVFQMETHDHTLVSWSNLTNIAVTNIATNLITFVGIDISGNVVQSISKFTNVDNRDYIFLGVIVHVDKTIVDAVNNEQAYIGSMSEGLRRWASVPCDQLIKYMI